MVMILKVAVTMEARRLLKWDGGRVPNGRDLGKGHAPSPIMGLWEYHPGNFVLLIDAV